MKAQEIELDKYISLKKFLDLNPDIKLKNLKKIIEIGGYGCMSDIFLKINKKINYTIYNV